MASELTPLILSSDMAVDLRGGGLDPVDQLSGLVGFLLGGNVNLSPAFYCPDSQSVGGGHSLCPFGGEEETVLGGERQFKSMVYLRRVEDVKESVKLSKSFVSTSFLDWLQSLL